MTRKVGPWRLGTRLINPIWHPDPNISDLHASTVCLTGLWLPSTWDQYYCFLRLDTMFFHRSTNHYIYHKILYFRWKSTHLKEYKNTFLIFWWNLYLQHAMICNIYITKDKSQYYMHIPITTHYWLCLQTLNHTEIPAL